MTSLRKRKKEAARAGFTEPALQLVELVEDLLDVVRWQQILGYANQFLIERRLEVDREERDRVLEAATRAVDRDRRLQDWRATLDRLKGELAQSQDAMQQALPRAPAAAAAGARAPARAPRRDAAAGVDGTRIGTQNDGSAAAAER